MRMIIHHNIGKNICSGLKELGCHINEKLFLLGNLFPDLIHSYLWRPHKYNHSREYIREKMIMLKNKPRLVSFHMGVLTHYICDYFCYPHSDCYDQGLLQHILYEIRQKTPDNYHKAKLNIKAFTIEELDKLVKWYEDFRKILDDIELDYHVAAMVSFGFLYASGAY